MFGRFASLVLLGPWVNEITLRLLPDSQQANKIGLSQPTLLNLKSSTVLWCKAGKAMRCCNEVTRRPS